MVGGVFATAWHKLSLDHQQLIKDQVEILKKKKYKLFPLLTDYFGSIGFAVERENADDEKIIAFLKVATLVIEKENGAKTSAFFHYCRDFFEYHALHYDKSYRLYARDDDYSIEFIKEASTEFPADTIVAKDVPIDTAQVAQHDMPSWMQTAPQPVLSGPVLKFENVTFDFATRYDSASLRNTRGAISLLDGTFVGERGSFGWDPAGLSADSVHYEFAEYNFNVDLPDVKCERGRLRYVGKAVAKIDGQFEFKSVSHKGKKAASYPRFISFQSNIPILGLSDERMKYTGGFSLNGRQISSASVSGDYSQLEVVGVSDKKFTARSKLFEFQDSVISAKSADRKSVV